jgi:uncharacterized OB-fold protein
VSEVTSDLLPGGVPAVEGWFTTPRSGDAERPRLIGGRCTTCGTFVFPPRERYCPNPACPGDELEQVPLSGTGTIWSYTENRYAPPPPFPASDPFEPYALAAVQLEVEGLLVLGKVATGVLAADLRVGMPVQLEIEPLFTDDEGVTRLVWVWAPAAPRGEDGE